MTLARIREIIEFLEADMHDWRIGGIQSKQPTSVAVQRWKKTLLDIQAGLRANARDGRSRTTGSHSTRRSRSSPTSS